jgi:hypothetical protein
MVAAQRPVQTNTTGDATLPSPEAVLAKYVEALGGRAALERLTSRVLRGTVEIEGANVLGTIEIFAKVPDRVFGEITLPGVATIRQGYDGKVAWEEGPRGFRRLEGDELAEVRRDAVFHSQLKLRELYPTLRVLRRETLGAHAAWVVEAIPEEGRPQQMWFDTESGLLLQTQSERPTPEGPVSLTVTQEDYRPADGILIPRLIHQRTPQFTLVIRFLQVEHNVPIEETKFRPPEPEPATGPPPESSGTS